MVGKQSAIQLFLFKNLLCLIYEVIASTCELRYLCNLSEDAINPMRRTIGHQRTACRNKPSYQSTTQNRNTFTKNIQRTSPCPCNLKCLSTRRELRDKELLISLRE